MKQRLLGLAILMALEGCSAGTHSRATNEGCAEALIRIHEHAHDINANTCERPCPGSPGGSACRTDDGGFTRSCAFS
ncbi:hypothetical protein D7W79_03865 [Corallococcus exercitus]|uniref:Lipoprotein n=1 Tax=Corallococcus exercitus TaxID=2316736 RepID=A0A3A8IH62_9BACT|nr:hypothetical protein [Corallococcus exercitus]NOK33015.1 hypothetical protein [Corallococcus exercitus]RKG81988.1 hypothetical protein D7W79_03865 [Corallococcus exercitus]